MKVPKHFRITAVLLAFLCLMVTIGYSNITSEVRAEPPGDQPAPDTDPELLPDFPPLSVMETNVMRGIVCACPTAGSAGIIPGCLYSLKQEGHSMIEITNVLKVAGAVGVIIGKRATFAAEIAGCMAETGSAAAMAAAGLAHAMGATPETAFNASAISLMNTLGLICDPVAGEVEVPCYARNIAGVGHAFVSASSAIGGFKSFIPFDEVVDTILKVGKSMSSDLKCTCRGGLALTPTAVAES